MKRKLLVITLACLLMLAPMQAVASCTTFGEYQACLTRNGNCFTYTLSYEGKVILTINYCFP